MSFCLGQKDLTSVCLSVILVTSINLETKGLNTDSSCAQLLLKMEVMENSD